MVPCSLLQPIVENAIQHGIAPTKTGGCIEASARRIGDKLRLQVRDNGAGTGQKSRGYGIGLRNTQERLALLYPGEHEFVAAGLATGGFQVTIEIPFEQVVG